jgi:F-type H+-transporting ATPase subunit b
MNLLVLAAETVHKPNTIILPSDINEVIWGTISFLIVFGLIWWKGGPAIKGMWVGRIERIRTEVETAAEARATAEAALAKVEADLADAETELGQGADHRQGRHRRRRRPGPGSLRCRGREVPGHQ